MRRTLVTLACLGAVATVAACGSETGQPTGSDNNANTQQQTTAAPEPVAKTADPPQAFDAAKPVAIPIEGVKTNMAGNVTSSFLTLRDRTAYIVTPKGMAAVDILTGKQTWTVPFEGTPGDPYNQSGPFVNTTGPRPPAVTDKLVAAAVPIKMPEQGTTPSYPALSVIAADPAGKKAWQVNIKIPADQYADANDAITKVVAVTDKAVIATYNRKGDNVITVALDPATGKTIWDHKDYDAGSVYGNVVVGTDYNVAENSSMTQATALDVATGEQKWAGALRSLDLTVFPSDPGLVAVYHSDYGTTDPYLLFLDAATGAEKGKVSGKGQYEKSAFSCDYDQQSVLLCSSMANGLVGYDAKTGKELWSLPDQASGRVQPQVSVVWHGVVYGKTNGGTPITLDGKTGKDISTDVGAAPYWVSKYGGIGVDKDGVPLAYPVKQ